MVWAAALALAGQTVAEPPAWSISTPTGSIYYVVQSEVKNEYPTYGYAITLWLHGLHQGDKTVNYRSSLWRLQLNCVGHFSVLAYSKYGADGMAIEESDRLTGPISIRPNTMYVQLENMFCANKK